GGACVIIGVPREVKPGEQRVALTPPGARALAEAGHRVVVERGAGAGSSIRDDEYTRVGATLATVDEVWGKADLVLKVKEPLPEEYGRLRAGQVLFTYLHLAPAPDLARALQAAVSILDVNLDRLRAVDDLFHGRVITVMSNSFNVDQVLPRADLLIGAVLVAGARAPVLVTKEMVASMKEGAVIVDVAVDQGGS